MCFASSSKQRFHEYVEGIKFFLLNGLEILPINIFQDLDMSPKDLEEFEFKVNVETNTFSKVVEWMGEHIG